jgi:C-terminus of histone H2A
MRICDVLTVVAHLDLALTVRSDEELNKLLGIVTNASGGVLRVVVLLVPLTATHIWRKQQSA